jgi:hypothetical protein
MLEGGEFKKKLRSNRSWLILINILFAFMFAALLGLLSGDYKNVNNPERNILIWLGIIIIPLVCLATGILIIGKYPDAGKGLMLFGIFSLFVSTLIYTIISKPKGTKEVIAVGYSLIALAGTIWFIFIWKICNFCDTTRKKYQPK